MKKKIKKFLICLIAAAALVVLTVFFTLLTVSPKIKIRTGLDAGVGLVDLVEFQEAFHREINPFGLLLACGYSGKYVRQGETGTAEYGDLILGDVLLLGDDDTVELSLYDKDFSMDTLTMVLVDQSCKIEAAINPAYIISSVSEEEARTIAGILGSVYDYEDVGVRLFSTGERIF